MRKNLLLLFLVFQFINNPIAFCKSENNLNNYTERKTQKSLTIDLVSSIDQLAKQGGGKLNLKKGTYFVDRDINLPENIELDFDGGAIINVSKGHIFKISSHILAGDFKIFSGQGRYEISGNEINVGWFGDLSYSDVNAGRNDSIPNQNEQAKNREGIQRAIDVAIFSGGGIIRIPNKKIYINGPLQIYANADNKAKTNHLPGSITIKGFGRYNSKIIETDPNADLLDEISITVNHEGISLLGMGSATSGDIVRMINCVRFSFDDYKLGCTGGRAIFMYNSERGHLKDGEISYCRQAIVSVGACNENYFNGQKSIQDCGMAQDEYGFNSKSYSINADEKSSKLSSDGGSWSQENHSAIELCGQNVELSNSSIKTTQHIAGVKIYGCENASLRNLYIEGYGIAPNPAVIIGGTFERFLTQEPITKSSKTVTVTDSKWAKFIAHNENEYSKFRDTLVYALYQPSDPSIIEYVSSYGFLNNQLIIKNRGVFWRGGAKVIQKLPREWPKGTIIRECTLARNDVSFFNIHSESLQHIPKNITLDTTYSNGHTNAEIVIGLPYDEFMTSENVLPAGWGQNATFYGKLWIRTYSPTGSFVKAYRQATIYNYSSEKYGNVFKPATSTDILTYHGLDSVPSNDNNSIKIFNYSISCDGKSKIISIYHGLKGINPTTPFFVSAHSADATGYTYSKIDAEKIYLYYPQAPAMGQHNLIFTLIIKP